MCVLSIKVPYQKSMMKKEMKEAVTKVIDTLTEEDFHGALQKLLERYNKCIEATDVYFEVY